MGKEGYGLSLAPQSGHVSTTESDSGSPGLVYLQPVFGHLMTLASLVLAFGATSAESEQLAGPRIKVTASRMPVTSVLLLLCFMPYLV